MQSLKLANRAASATSTTKNSTKIPPSTQAPPTAAFATAAARPLLAAATAAAATVALVFSPAPPSALAAGVPDPGCSLTTAEKSKIQFCDSVAGTGAAPSPNARVRAHYTGRLSPSGAVFDSSYERRRPLEFKKDQVVKGWGIGIFGDGEVPPMREGGKRRLVIPPELAYGDRGAGGVIPGGATLVFDVELLGPRRAG